MSAFDPKRTSARVLCCDAVHSSRPKIVLNFEEGGSPPGNYPMRRREFISLLGSIAAWPLAARAQQAAGMRRIAFLHPYVENDPEVLARVIAFREGLDVLVGSGTPITAALKRVTGTIPIVFNVVNDPVGQGFVASLARPGGNITGFTFIDFPLIGKWAEL